MGTIAKSSITLVSISDAYALSLTPNSCVIKADFDGSNPKLEQASTIISALCGDEKAPIEIDSNSIIKSNSNIQYLLTKIDSYRYQLKIQSLPIDILEGYIELTVTSGINAIMQARFTFTVVRESTMLDWIQDWENNKTTIGDSYVITPKIFVGKKITGSYDSLQDVPGLTGVYIGPSANNSAGLYGYKNSQEIFHLDETGGKIGGWDIATGGIQNADGTLTLKSDGSISSQSNGITHWVLNKDGSASFANGKVTMDSAGNAVFEGTIQSKAGSIGGWTINDNNLYSIQIGLNSASKYVAIANITSIPMYNGQWDGNHLAWTKAYGGVAMYYSSGSDFGFIAYKGTAKVFSAGSSNLIAGWQFDEAAIWLGTKNNNVNQYTSASGSITIGTNGLRGYSWYINKDGSASFVKGYVTFGPTSGKIAGWNFDADSFYIGTKKNTTSAYTSASGSITIGSYGIRGYKWYLNSDGSGSLAGGNITWDTSGNVTLSSSVTIAWANISGAIGNKLTKIDANGIYTGTLTASQVNALTCTFDKGTIGGWTIGTDKISKNSVSLGSDGSITNGTYWKLNTDGSGSLAGGNITWDTSGSVSMKGKITATSGSIGGFEIGSNRIGTTATSSGGGGSLAIYDDFLRVGGTNGYAMFGDDVIPASAGGAFTATGRIVNNHPNTYGNYGFDQANYGLFINVSGGTKNYGIHSDAALMAPAFINTKAKILTLTGNGYTVDFSQNNIILLYYNDSNYSGVDVTLPTESSVARQFGLSSLPSDFATIVIFRVRQGSKRITLLNIYDHNENLTNYAMEQGDSVMLLITKADGFRYQILNYSS